MRLALDRHLTISVNFVNHAKARFGKVVGIEDVTWRELSSDFVDMIPNIPEECKGKPTRFMVSENLDDERYLNLDSDVKTIDGVWDLPMIGNEKLDIEHRYQRLTGGPMVTLQNMNGTLVEGQNGVMCVLQERFESNEFQPGSKANLEKLAERLNSLTLNNEETVELLAQSRLDRKKFIERQKTRPDIENYYPAGGLPEDSVIVVRTEALRAFEQLLSENENAQDADNSKPKKQKTNQTEVNGHTERHAASREQILGAAFAILVKYPDQCHDSKGELRPSKVADLVWAKANLFWPNSQPPLKEESIADHLREWIKKASTRK